MITTIHKTRARVTGFTMLEVVIVIAVIAILAGLIAPLAVNTIKQSRVNACWEEIQIIKKVIVGDPTLVEGGSRSSFGFVGDLGVMPATLDELINRDPIRPTYQPYLTSNMYFGWRGPYISK
jgi:prepilin-type N-terminal cleavage/methylation domain-containing protein